jgi:hypothetical protein
MHGRKERFTDRGIEGETATVRCIAPENWMRFHKLHTATDATNDATLDLHICSNLRKDSALRIENAFH